VFCVALDAPPGGRPRQVMMEARFLEPYADVLEQVVRDLGDFSLTSGAPQTSCSPEPRLKVTTEERDGMHAHVSAVEEQVLQCVAERRSASTDKGCRHVKWQRLAVRECRKMAGRASLVADPLLLVPMLFSLLVAFLHEFGVSY